MKFLDRLDRLRGKPEAHRKRVAFFSAFLVTALIGVVWASTLPAAFAGLDSSSAVAGAASSTVSNGTSAPAGGIESPFDSLKASVLDGFNGLKSVFSGSTEISNPQAPATLQVVPQPVTISASTTLQESVLPQYQ